MVTAILPPLTDETSLAEIDAQASDSSATLGSRSRFKPRNFSGTSVSDSLASEATVTPEAFASSIYQQRDQGEQSICPYSPGAPKKSKPAALAGFVGLFTGCGALLALVLFLPLPARFGTIEGVTPAKAVEYSYYVVAAAAVVVAVFVGFGLGGLQGEEGKGWGVLFGRNSTRANITESQDDGADSSGPKFLPYRQLLVSSITLGFTDSRIGLGYLGGFVARASTVAISLFIPLAVNDFYMRNGFCQGSPNDPSPELKKECRQAYILASILTGVAQLVGLICAPVFGYLGSRTAHAKMNWPVIFATVVGMAGYMAFARLKSPETRDVDGRGGGPGVFIVVSMIGVSQIGAIVCSFGILGRGILTVDEGEEAAARNANANTNANANANESARLLPEDDEAEASVTQTRIETSRVKLKGSIAGVYSWFGGVAILLLTKLGGYLFDTLSIGAPFYMMALFNGVLLVATVVVDVARLVRERRSVAL